MARKRRVRCPICHKGKRVCKCRIRDARGHLIVTYGPRSVRGIGDLPRSRHMR